MNEIMKAITDSSCSMKKDDITSFYPLPSSAEIKTRNPLIHSDIGTVIGARNGIKDILLGKSERFLVVIDLSLVDATKVLGRLAEKFRENILLLGSIELGLGNDWGEISSIGKKISAMRDSIIRTISSAKLPIGVEISDNKWGYLYSYISDLASYLYVLQPLKGLGVIASGLNLPVGFKCVTNWLLTATLNEMEDCKSNNIFVGPDDYGTLGIINTSGNTCGHMITDYNSNYDEDSILIFDRLQSRGLNPRIVVVCNQIRDIEQLKIFSEKRGNAKSGTKIVGCILKGIELEGVQSFLEKIHYSVPYSTVNPWWVSNLI